MSGTWIISVDVDGLPWLIQVLPESKIGPFDSMSAAETARQELAAAAKERVMQ